jgi:lipopolysaccharide export system permease protein
MPRLVVIVLPLSILLASIMVFGNFAENYEFAAMKSTGISLQRAMRSLTVFIVCLSGIAFLFANYAIPRAEFEFLNLRRNIAKVKPAMAISKGQFNFIGEDINIKVADKFGDKDQFLTDVVIHMKEKNRIGNYTVILANEGELISSDDQPLLSLKLKDGNYYREIYQTDIKKKKREPFARSYFETYTLNIDLSALDDVDFDDKTIDNAYTMLNVVELNDNIQKQSEDITENLKKFGDQFIKKSGFTKLNVVGGVVAKDTILPNLLDNYERQAKIQILDIAKSSVKGNIVTLDNRRLTFMRKIKTINKYEIAVHEKYVLAFSCLILFFVGAPLGAIIRKGGLGLPIVIGMLIFLTFHFIGIFAKNGAEDNSIHPFVAAWISSFIMLPLGIYFTYRATTDQGLFDISGFFLVPIKRLFSKRLQIQEIEEAPDVIPTYSLTVEEQTLLDARSSNQLKDIVKNYKQYNYSENMRWAAIDKLAVLGITTEHLKVQGYYENKNYVEAERHYKKFRTHSKWTLVTYLLFVVVSVITSLLDSEYLFFDILFVVLYYYFVIMQMLSISDFNKAIGKPPPTGFIIIMCVTGPISYLFFHVYFKKRMKEDMQTMN